MKNFVILSIICIVFFISCSNEMIKNTVWEGSGTAKDSWDDSFSEKYTIEEAIFYWNGTVSFTLVADNNKSLTGTFEGNYSLDNYENLTFNAINSYFACIGSGKLSYYSNSGSGKAYCAGLEMTWEINKVSDF